MAGPAQEIKHGKRHRAEQQSMQCFLLGTGGMMPMPHRRLSSVLVRTELQDYLLDAGEGIQVSFKELGLGIKRLAVVAITHLHADHCLGLPGILMLRSQVEQASGLTIVGPVGIKRFVEHVRSDLRSRITFPIRYVELRPNENTAVALKNDDITLSWAKLNHSVDCVGYRLQEPSRPGRFHPERASALGVPQGPLWGRLQHGDDVETQDGRIIRPNDVMGHTRRGRSLAFATDTRPCPGLDQTIWQADLAFVEGMFMASDKALAKEKYHMTVIEAATAAKRAQVRRLVLTHISPRYANAERRTLQDQARTVFPGAIVGRDLQDFVIPMPED